MGILEGRFIGDGRRVEDYKIGPRSFRHAPAILKAHAATLKADPAMWTFLTGDEANLSHFAAQFGLAVVRNDKDANDISHTLRTVVIDGDGKIVKTFSGNSWTPAELLASLKAVPAPAH